MSPYTNWHPSRGYYDGTRSSVVANQIADMQWAGLDAGIASWWDQGSKEDSRIPMLLDTANGTSFRWSLYYEPEGYGDPSCRPSLGRHQLHCETVRRRKLVSPGGRQTSDLCVCRWHRWLRNGRSMGEGKPRPRIHRTQGVFRLPKLCGPAGDARHEYAPAVARDQQDKQSFSVSPGFWLKGGSERLDRDAQRFDADVAAMATSGARFSVTTYNEWGEGTAVESADEWADESGHGIYMSILRNHLVKNSSPTTDPPATGGSSTGSAPVIAAAGDIPACRPTDGLQSRFG